MVENFRLFRGRAWERVSSDLYFSRPQQTHSSMSESEESGSATGSEVTESGSGKRSLVG